MTENISLKVNGQVHELEVDPSTPLVYVLRNDLGLTGAKIGCGIEQCGACAVLVDGKSTPSCASPVGQFKGCDIVTVEGLRGHSVGEAVQKSLVEAGAGQCGYCIPGMVVALTALFGEKAWADEAAICEALEPHLCRCGAHARVLAAARRLTQETAP